MKRICHIAAPPRNFGDAALVYGLHNRLREEAPECLVFDMVDIQSTIFSPQLIDAINDTYDAILVGGGGLVMNREDLTGRKTASGWQWDIALNELWQIQIPLIVYGVGFNEFPHPNERGKVSDHAIDHLLMVGAKAKAFSFRDSQSAWRCKAPDADIVPDPALWIEPHKYECIPTFKGNRINIGLNWAGDRVDQRWRPGDNMVELYRAICALGDDSEFNVWHIPHHPDDTRRGEFEVMQPAYVQVPLLAGLYHAMDCVIGMRGHSNIIAAAVGTTPISVGHHPKNRWFMESIDCEDLHIEDNATTAHIRDLVKTALNRKVQKPQPNREFDRAVINAF